MASKILKRLGIALTGMALAVGVGVGLSQRGEYKEARAATTYVELKAGDAIDTTANYVMKSNNGKYYTGSYENNWGASSDDVSDAVFFKLSGSASAIKAKNVTSENYLRGSAKNTFTEDTLSNATTFAIITTTVSQVDYSCVATTYTSQGSTLYRYLNFNGAANGGFRWYNNTAPSCTASPYAVTFYKVVTDDPTLSVDITSAKIKKDDATGVTITATALNDAESSVLWTNNSTSILDVTDNGDGTAKITGKAEGTGTITVSFSTATPITITVRVFELASGTSAANAYAVEDIIYQIDQDALLDETTYYVTGVVSSIVGSYNSETHKQTVFIKDSFAGATETFELYNFSCDFDPAISVGDILTAYGTGNKYYLYAKTSTYELSGGNLYTDSLKTISSISISGTLVDDEYNAGENFDPDGLTVTATYSNGSTYNVTNLVTWSPSPFVGGETSVRATYSYNGNSAYDDQDVTVSTNSVTSIAIASNPTNATYYVGQLLDKTGLSVTVNYELGDPETITSGFNIADEDVPFTYADSVVGTKTFTVSYSGKSTTFSVNVKKTVVVNSNAYDDLDAELIGVTSYTNWSDKSDPLGSSAVYAGNTTSEAGYAFIQFRSSNNSGIVSTSSGGLFHSLEIEWNSTKSTATRTLNIYGKNTAYASSADLYSNATKGTLIGSLTLTYDDVNKEVTSQENYLSAGAELYRYIGICSNSGAIYLNSIRINWASPAADEDVNAVNNFVSEKMHLDHTTNDGSCKTNGWYSTASSAFSGLTTNQKSIILNSLSNYGSVSETLWTYRDVRDRLEAWAIANGETFNTTSGTFSRTVTGLDSNINADNSSMIIVVAIVVAFSLTIVGGYFFIRRHKEN